MKIVTVSREFGSGGREIGKRLADELGFDYYDREIIDAVAKSSSLDSSYVERVLEAGLSHTFHFTFGRTFLYNEAAGQSYTSLLLAQQRFIEKIPEIGRSFVIVGRSADCILKKYNPFNIFVYADAQSKIERCRQRAADGEDVSDRALMRKMKQIDQARERGRELTGASNRSNMESFHLCVNTGQTQIKKIIPALAELVKAY